MNDEKTLLRIKNLLVNLKNWDYDIANYKMPKKEADLVVEIMEEVMKGEQK